MILVTVGTNEARFDRLLEALAGLPDGKELFVQHGPSPIRPAGATCTEYLAFEELAERVREADAVVTHAGVGSILTALLNGARPIVVPRLQRYGEAVDDHQLDFGRRAADACLVTLVEDVAELPAAVARLQASPPQPPRPDERLITDLRSFLAGAVGGDPGYSM